MPLTQQSRPYDTRTLIVDSGVDIAGRVTVCLMHMHICTHISISDDKAANARTMAGSRVYPSRSEQASTLVSYCIRRPAAPIV